MAERHSVVARMRRTDLEIGDEVIITETTRGGAATEGMNWGYWTARVIDPEATYPGWVDINFDANPTAQRWKELPGVTVEITGYKGSAAQPDVRDYNPRVVRNNYGGGTEVRNGQALRVTDPTRRNAPDKTYGVGEQVTITAWLIVNTVEGNEAVIEARQRARERRLAEQEERQQAARELRARAEAVGLTLGNERGKTVITTPIAEVIERLEQADKETETLLNVWQGLREV